MKNKLKNINWLSGYKSQLILNILISITLIIISQFTKLPKWPYLFPFTKVQFYILNFTFIILALITLTVFALKKSVPHLLNGILILTLPYFYTYLWTSVVNLLWTHYSKLNVLIGILYFTGCILLYLPILFVEYPSIENKFLRLISYLCLSIGFYLYPPVLTHNEILNTIIGILAISLILEIEWIVNLCHIWGIHLKVEFPLYCKKWVATIFYIAVICFAIFLSFLNAFIYSAQGFDQVLGNWDLISANWSFHIYSFDLDVFLFAAAAGIHEELARYFWIVLLLAAFRNNKLNIPIAILGSSLIFGTMHFTHLFTNSFMDTIQTVITSFGLGILYATVYLISGKLWLTMFSHFLADFMAYVFIPSGGGMWGMYGNQYLIVAVILTLILIIFTIILLSVPSYRRSLKINASNLINLAPNGTSEDAYELA